MILLTIAVRPAKLIGAREMNKRIEELIVQATTYRYRRGLSTEIELFDKEKFAELIVKDYAKQLVQANMSNREYAQAMDEHYEQKWAHRFD